MSAGWPRPRLSIPPPSPCWCSTVRATPTSSTACARPALRCIGGQMQCRLILDSEEKRERAHKMGVTDPKMIYGIEDLARGDCLFAATGVTTGSLLSGVKFRKDVIETETVVMRSVTGTVRYIKAEHRQLDKFHLD